MNHQPPMPESVVSQMEFKLKLDERVQSANADRSIELNQYTLSIFKTTLDRATKTYKHITWMNFLMFSVGLALFVTAAVYGVLANSEKGYSILFAGLGGATFVALFLTGPIEKTQTALSNLLQAEIGFMNYFEQITLWEVYALRPQANSPIPDSTNIETASANLQQRTAETLELFQNFLEPKPDSR